MYRRLVHWAQVNKKLITALGLFTIVLTLTLANQLWNTNTTNTRPDRGLASTETYRDAQLQQSIEKELIVQLEKAPVLGSVQYGRRPNPAEQTIFGALEGKITLRPHAVDATQTASERFDVLDLKQNIVGQLSFEPQQKNQRFTPKFSY